MAFVLYINPDKYFGDFSVHGLICCVWVFGFWFFYVRRPMCLRKKKTFLNEYFNTEKDETSSNVDMNEYYFTKLMRERETE